ncbi:MAG TPA: SBBP repeat-containing protein, partial [Blastocatellia bacterium]|nr:SBBP repeat-containing protein [Blastocatellia bacterium]
MKRIAVIAVILLVLGGIPYTLIVKPSAAASVATAVQLRSFFSINNIEVTEGANPQAVFTVTLTYDGGVREFISSVNYATESGTASAPADYQQTTGTVTFPPGPTPGGTVSMTVSIPIVDDSAQEGDETFTVFLSNPSPAFAIQGRGTCTIHDNDSGPSGLVILDTEIGEGDSGTTDAVFRVGRNGPTDSAISVDFTTENLSAVAGSDYLSRTGTLTIPAGQRSANITVPIIGDTLPERTQGFFVRLSNARNAAITDGEAVGVILDDDDPEAITACSNDTPLQFDRDFFTSDSIAESIITIDRDLIVDDLEVKLFISNRTGIFIRLGFVSASLTRSPAFRPRTANLFERLTLPELSSIGTTCSPTPDFIISPDAVRRLRDHDGEAPYIGRWQNLELPHSPSARFSGPLNARGPWHLGLGVLGFNAAQASATLECWCLSIVGPREGLRLTPSRAVVPIFDGIGDGDDFRDAAFGRYTVTARVNANGGPAADVPVTFTLRDPAGRVLPFADAANVITTDGQGRATFSYFDWVPGEYTIEARAVVNGAIYTDIARVTWTNPCAATAAVQGAADAEATLNAMRQFRDSKLAGSKRGREYARLYYKFSAEAMRLMLFNPMLAVRSQEMIERYLPVVRDMAAGRGVTLTEGDLKEIDGFMNDFAARGSPELQQTVKGLREELRNPEAHQELGVTVMPGARREMPARGQLQGSSQAGELTVLFGLFLGGVLLARWRRRNGLRGLLCVALALSVVGGQWPVASASLTSANHAPAPPAPGSASGKLPLAFKAIQGQAEGRVLDYSTYLGGGGDDQGTAITADAEGNLYLVGITDSTNLPTVNAAQPAFGGGVQDIFVAKLDPSGTRLVYLTYLGGGGNDTATGMAVDAAGNAYLTGFTTSTNFPTLNALQPNNRGRFNGFVTKLGPTGNLIYSTYLGGTTNDSGSGIAVDAAGNAYVAGIATSPDFPTVNALQPGLSGAADVYVAKLNPAGNQFVYSTYMGGSQEDAATGIAVDPSGNVYVTGATLSSDFRMANAAQPAHGGGIFDGFVMKLNPAGSQLIYSTYLGGGNGDRGMRIAADAAGNAYVTGDTRSADFPTRGAAQQALGGSSDAFVTKLNPNGALAYSTFLGGTGIDGGTAVAVDATGAAVVTG